MADDPMPSTPPAGDDPNLQNQDPVTTPPASSQKEAPDRDTEAWEGTESSDAIGLVDPRHEIPNPPGL